MKHPIPDPIYTYDSLNRLETVTEPNGTMTRYTFDKAGNRLTEAVTKDGNTGVTIYTYNEQNRLLSTTSIVAGATQKVTYTYDNNGNMLTSATTIVKTAEQDAQPAVDISAAGQSPTNDVTFNQYDAWNRLVKTTVGSNTVTSTYNGDGLRTSKTVNGETTRYLYEYDRVILEEDGQGNESARNVYGTNLLQRTDSGDTYYYMYNGHGDVTALLGTDGSIPATYYYDAFGNITEQSVTGNVYQPFKYAGYVFDDQTGLYYLNSRYYDPKIARFLSEDTYNGNPNDPLSLNLYTYCHNEPIMYIDPSGYSDVAVRASNESQGNQVNYTQGKTAGSSSITITTSNGKSTTLKEGKDYYLGKDGKAYYTNNPSNAVRATNESNGNHVDYKYNSPNSSTIQITTPGTNSKSTTLVENKDYYVGNDGKAYYYGNIRSTNESQGYKVTYTAGIGGSSSITITNQGTNQKTVLREGLDYYIGADGKAHSFSGASSQGPVVVKSTNNINSGNEKIDKFVNAAVSQVGYKETGDNITKYGKWYGMNGQPWCAMFVSWSANEAGILNTVVPKYASVQAGKEWYKDNDRYESRESGYTPKEGDVIFFRKNGQNHTGIVVAYDPKEKVVYTVEGNTSDSVKIRHYSITDSYITGYGTNGSTSNGTIPGSSSSGTGATTR